ncbi:outer membrane protein assembly factor BamE [Paraburkholderia gardini]|uniref:outer membrane protein assembly factor BamE n=1 Tax=Paraburkholderia gardini TaxID=2823469 RepID=UPI001D60FD3C|nr:outer membrane protein assembly factor BamE [Paraburkholderia gardini]CAG4906175.1 hypothetical protein R69919_03363 [Paraburkholderia gardini]
MNKIAAIFLGAVLVGVLSGCAGTNFVRPNDADLQNGKTTLAEVRVKYGDPFRESNVTRNDEDVKLLSYAYASTGGTPLDTGAIPARSLELAFWKDALVSNVFNSSFKDDASAFDASKRTAIVKGKTTRAQVIELLGRPAGYAIYPVIKDKNGQALVYSYHTTSGSAFSLKFSRRDLIVTVDPNGLVTDVSYESSGMQ